MGYDRYLDWFDEALDDLAAAEDLCRLGRYSKACFFSHQAAEKAVKALIIRKLRRSETIHSVAELLRRLRSRIDVPEELVREGGASRQVLYSNKVPSTHGLMAYSTNTTMRRMRG